MRAKSEVDSELFINYLYVVITNISQLYTNVCLD